MQCSKMLLSSCCLCCWVASEFQTPEETSPVTSGSLCWSGSRLPSVSCFVLQEGALTALASVADAANAHFIRYYDTVMPMLKHVLYSASSKAEQLLRAKALECVSLVGMAVGKERFRSDAQEVMAFMQQLQVSFLCTFGCDTCHAQFKLAAGKSRLRKSYERHMHLWSRQESVC